ncbi:hypothetical protein [Sphingomonas sp. PB4P5]|uniref:hypothetical protein n=1 Tax=Parasphingomonas puruogangriensis TaxID=3096155 RepID=UPI002FCC89BA
MTTRADMLFIAEMSVRYHRRRATFLDRTSAGMSVIILAGGASAFGSLFGTSTVFAQVVTLILAVVGLIQVIFQVDRAAADHRRWLKEWLSLVQQIKSNDDPAEGRIREWQKRQYEIEAECVGELRALQVDCFNRTVAALDLDADQTAMRWWHRAFIQVISFESSFAKV